MKLTREIIQHLGEALDGLDLDPVFFTKDNLLDPEVVKVLQEVTDDVMGKLKDKGYDFPLEGVILTGSLTSVNYDASSDVDFHILVDFKQFDDPKLMANFLSAFAKNYNAKDFDLRDRNLELYFQDADEPHVTPGIYDIMNNKWLMPPDGIKIEKTPEMLKAAEDHKKKVQSFVKEWNSMDQKNKPLIRDFLTKLQNYFEGLRKMRKEGIASGGIASVGNQVFKLLRRNDTFRILTELMNNVQDQIFEA